MASAGGNKINIQTNGVDEERALDELVGLIEDKFGENKDSSNPSFLINHIINPIPAAAKTAHAM